MPDPSRQMPPKVPPKWVVLAFLAGAISAFVAAFMAFSFNAGGALTFGLIALALYVAGAIGYARAPRRAAHPAASGDVP